MSISANDHAQNDLARTVILSDGIIWRWNGRSWSYLDVPHDQWVGEEVPPFCVTASDHRKVADALEDPALVVAETHGAARAAEEGM